MTTRRGSHSRWPRYCFARPRPPRTKWSSSLRPSWPRAVRARRHAARRDLRHPKVSRLGRDRATAVVSAFARHTDCHEASVECADLACMARIRSTTTTTRSADLALGRPRHRVVGQRDKLELKVTVYSPEGAVLASSIFSARAS
jgi:hypothetical protein